MQRNSAGGLYGARGAHAPGRHWITVRLKEEGGERVRVFIQARGAEFARFRVVEQRAHDVAPRNVVDGLRAQAINYVTRSDIVGALLYHPETREFCAARLDENAHALSAFLFQPDGYPVPAGRMCASRAIETASRIALHGLRSLQSSATING